jgi:ATP-dependent Zn protease
MEPNKRLNPEQPRAAYRWWILVGVIALGAVLISVFAANTNTRPEAISLPEIVDAVEAGQVEKITVQGDMIVATTTSGDTLSARKESNISAIEAMQLIGASPDTLRDLPIVVVEDAGAGVLSFFSILLTLAPLLFIGFII